MKNQAVFDELLQKIYLYFLLAVVHVSLRSRMRKCFSIRILCIRLKQSIKSSSFYPRHSVSLYEMNDNCLELTNTYLGIVQ